MTIEYEIEPIPGLPGNLPPGETIIWQGVPDWRSFARAVFHTRLVTAWFLFVAAMAFVAGGTGLKGALITLAVALVGLGLLAGLAYTAQRSTIYTLTNRRVVMRFGAALPKCVNLPLIRIGSADIKPAGDGFVDVALLPTQRFPLGWLQMWPHVRPWQVARPQPMLRAVPEDFTAILAAALAAAHDQPLATRAAVSDSRPDSLPGAVGVAA